MLLLLILLIQLLQLLLLLLLLQLLLPLLLLQLLLFPLLLLFWVEHAGHFVVSSLVTIESLKFQAITKVDHFTCKPTA